ncbi:kynurenine formamidase [Neorhizobium galegae]|uniref:cyclase family protein n=1 Tax=Neorhizobium galegae TaxID=399 RepID=UPI00278B171B|nr:cyclase family protein [Neorhizobium galegae]MDQ0138082.1 kynurenine formamidase [Neorhizobium galegae]
MVLRWKKRPVGSNWGDFGPDDELGRLNLVTPDKVLSAIREVKAGLSFSLSLPLDLPGGNWVDEQRFPPVLYPTISPLGANANRHRVVDGMRATDILNDDMVQLYTHYSTHWDGLSHIGQLFDAAGESEIRPLFYNGFSLDEKMVESGHASVPHSVFAQHLGIENAARQGIQTRGVLIDLAANFGHGRTVVDYDLLQDVIKRDDVIVEEGDIVCFHTGFAAALTDRVNHPDPRAILTQYAALDGRDHRLLKWITESGLVALAADNPGVENMPARGNLGCCSALPLHEHCLFKSGIILGELWHLTPLASYLRENRRNRFLLTAPPLWLSGASGSPTNPVATV